MKKLKKIINEVQKKTATQKKTKSVLHAGKHRVCTQKIQKSKYTQNKTELQNTRIHSVLFWTREMLLKFIIGNFFFM